MRRAGGGHRAALFTARCEALCSLFGHQEWAVEVLRWQGLYVRFWLRIQLMLWPLNPDQKRYL
uniref:Uncharacterized protein n=1 Tax=Ralstonia solanacearum TaxID=305 RepID=A0A0S4W7I1_RALSL|nr:protein of unknown function [Ralstonia solanacearum]CUV33350.1 protein of unknown function [Ralstonia solanacearum]CUV42672.1 protein of unknown function [Ralstonia solanacearum]CUV62458.1 protein of unknown function [Ralstonia solanacearum]